MFYTWRNAFFILARKYDYPNFRTNKRQFISPLISFHPKIYLPMYSLLPEFLPLTSIYENLNAQIRSVAIQSQTRVFYHRKIVILGKKSCDKCLFSSLVLWYRYIKFRYVRNAWMMLQVFHNTAICIMYIFCFHCPFLLAYFWRYPFTARRVISFQLLTQM